VQIKKPDKFVPTVVFVALPAVTNYSEKMKMIRPLLMIFFMALGSILIQCSEDEPINDNQEEPKTVAFALAEGYPKVRAGAKSIDVDVKTTKAAEVFYVLSDLPLTLTKNALRQEAASPTIPSIKGHGTFNVIENQESKGTITGLIEKKVYNVYVLVSNPADTTKDSIFTQPVQMKIRHEVIPFVSASENRTADLLVYRPENVLKYPEKKHAVIYFIAGAGEIARPDINKPINLMRNGTLTQYIGRGNDVPLMVVSIQHSLEEWNLELITEAIKFSKENLSADPLMQYLVGISAGAFAVWDYAVAHPEEFAAIAPISGGGQNSLACNLKNMGVWGFHNQQDNEVGPIRTIGMINDILACGPTKEVKITLFPDLGHNCWRRVFDPNHPDWAEFSPDMPRIDLYNWLLKFKKDGAS
jgi:hypothetical protein